MFHDPRTFEFISLFEKRWEDIRSEYLNLDPRVLSIHRDGDHEEILEQVLVDNGWMPSWQVGSDEPNQNWLTYGLSYQGVFPREAAQKFPVTMDLLSRLDGFNVCAFSVMKARSFIAPHRHPELGGNLLTFHLGIEVSPRRSYLCVGGKFEEEKNRKALVFDGSKDHFAINMGAKKRAILYMEFDKSKARMS